MLLSPLGLDAGRRLRTVKDAEALRDAQNIVLLPTVRKFAEQAKRDEFARKHGRCRYQDKTLQLNAQLAYRKHAERLDYNLGMTAAQQAGDALTQRYNLLSTGRFI